MKKKLLPRLLCLLGLLACIATASAAGDDFVVENGRLTAYRGAGGAIAIPDGVTDIAPSAFAENTAITSVTFPASVQSVGNLAFWKCSGLSEVRFSEGLLAIGHHAFAECPLQSVSLPDSLLLVNGGAFTGCPSLSSVRLSSETSCGYGAFYQTPWGDKNLTYDEPPWPTVGLPGMNDYASVAPAVPTAKSGDFTLRGGIVVGYHGKGGDIVLPEGATGIGANAFAKNTAITSVTAPTTLRCIGRSAFDGCTALKRVSPLPDNFLHICQDAFWNCEALTFFDMPSAAGVHFTAFRGTPYQRSDGRLLLRETMFPSVRSCNGQFTDAAGAWYAPYLTRAYEAGVWEAPADGLFRPNGTVTVSEALQIIASIYARAVERPDLLDAANPQATQAVLARYTALNPQDWKDGSRPIRRDEFAFLLDCSVPSAYIWMIDGITLYNEPFPDLLIPLGDDLYDDVPYASEIRELYSKGVVSKYDDGKFHPERRITRAEAVVMTARLIEPSLRIPDYLL